MDKSSEEIDAFWRWFEDHRADFDALVDPDAPFWDVALSQLQSIDQDLWFELSNPPPGESDRKFIFTAAGHKELFPLVEAIVARAPTVSGWEFIALKPPRGFNFSGTYEGIRFDPKTMWFLPLKDDSLPEGIQLRVGVPEFSPAIERQTGNVVITMLETALGERVVALDISHIEVGALPESPEADGYIKLPELPVYIESQKNSGV